MRSFRILPIPLKLLIQWSMKTKKAVTSLEVKEDYLSQHSKRNVLRFVGCIENASEDTAEIVLNVINNELNVPCDKNEIDSAFRIGSYISGDNTSKPRTILVQFVTNIKRNEVFLAKKHLKNSNISVFEDLTKQRFNLLQAAKRKYGKNKAWSSGGKIYVWDAPNNKKSCVFSITEL
ncbi:hypothetical protein NQ317_007809 [Molorchus minor]|uniref:Uncharacterized protein n=1 Tax=Molorchus minor TaxID=1323400 RepID=A0ABQ9IR64_9CUCU|nr:hypothetical protein NQ317_007809 [Molorchus minor]